MTTYAHPRPRSIVLCELAETGVPGLASYSPYCLKVHRALAWIGLPYTSRRGLPADFGDVSPVLQVPILLVDDEPIADSTRILRTLARRFPEAGLVPADPRAAAEAWLWEDWADRAFGGYVTMARWADDQNWQRAHAAFFGSASWLVRTFVAPRVRSRVVASLVARDVTRAGLARAYEDFRTTLDLLEARAPLEGFWTTASGPTVADLGLFAMIHALRNDLTPREAREIKLRPALTDWLDRVDDATRAHAAAPASQRSVTLAA